MRSFQPKTLTFGASGRVAQIGCIVVADREGRCLACLNSNHRMIRYMRQWNTSVPNRGKSPLGRPHSSRVLSSEEVTELVPRECRGRRDVPSEALQLAPALPMILGDRV
jgi:hypothetical protein